MCYRTFLLFCVLIINGAARAQENLIINGDFEDYTECPIPVDQIQFVTGVSSPNPGTPDYYNSDCGTAGSPVNYVTAYSGKGFMGFVFWVNGSPVREYIQLQLSTTLDININYKLSFYMRKAKFSNVSLTKFQILFSKSYVFDSLAIFDQISEFSIELNMQQCFTDSVWTRFETNYTSNGGEIYLVFGNFIDWDKTEKCTKVDSNSLGQPYYFVDNFALKEVGIFCNPPNVFSPNNDGVNDTWSLFEKNNENLTYNVSIYNRWGKLIRELSENNSIWDGNINSSNDNMPNGVYFYIATYTYNNITQQKKGTVTLVN